MYKKQFTAVTIGGPESTLGTAVARTKRFPVTGLSLLQRKPSKSDNEVITGRNAKSGDVCRFYRCKCRNPKCFTRLWSCRNGFCWCSWRGSLNLP